MINEESNIVDNSHDDSYELKPGMFSNKEQTVAIDGLVSFLDPTKSRTNKKVFEELLKQIETIPDEGLRKQILKNFKNSNKECEAVLIGRGGTGKTTIISKVLSIVDTDFIGLTLAHKAKNVLSESIGHIKGCKGVHTIASALAIKLNEITGEFEPDQYRRTKGEIPIRDAKIIVVDEGSMISEKIKSEIDLLKRSDAKIIYMGDNAQLPPIGEDKDSIIFSISRCYKLINRMRQGEDSPIVALTDVIAKNIEQPIVVNRCISDRTHKVNNEGSLFFINDFVAPMINDFKEALYNGKNLYREIKAITFNNQYHRSPLSVLSLNNIIRKGLYSHLPYQQFFENEPLISFSRYTDGANNLIFDPGTDLTVLSAKEGIINVEIDDSTPARKKTMEFKKSYRVVYLSIRNELTKGIHHGIPVIHIQDQQNLLNDTAYYSKIKPIIKFRLLEYFAEVSYGYAINAHKAQGSTYETVYCFEDNLLGSTAGNSNKIKNQGLYVACSRPRKKLVIVSNLNNN